MKRVILKIIAFYQRQISPHTVAACRFQPTCSEYTRIAVERFGALRGGWMGIRRIFRCNPLFKGGYDPVPELPDGAIRRD